MKRGAFHTPLFAESEDMANEIYTANEEHPIASPIYPRHKRALKNQKAQAKKDFLIGK